MSESSEKTDKTKRGDKRGILRLDINKPRNSSGSVEFRHQPELISEVKIHSGYKAYRKTLTDRTKTKKTINKRAFIFCSIMKN